MSLTLILTGEIQVNIRFLVSLKAKEGLKGNVKSVLYKRFPAYRTVLIRHITPCISCIRLYLRRIKIIIMTVGTPVMRT